MFCEKCGKELPDRALFCNRCGNRMVPESKTGAVPEYGTNRKRMSEELVKQVDLLKAGHTEAFPAVYEESYKYLHTCVIHIVKDEDTAQDILQDTYVEIHRNIGQLRSAEDFLGWAATIANRKCFAWLKKNREDLVGEQSDEEGNEKDFFDAVADDESFIPENIFDNQAKINIIRGIIDDLSDVQRACVIGFYYNEQKQEEIAAQLGIPVNTVKSHLNRAKAKIKESVSDVEKKQGVKLYSLAPFMLLLFGHEAKAYATEHVVPPMVGAGSGLVTATVAATGAAAGAKAVGTGITIKLIAAIVAGVVGIGTVTGVVLYNTLPRQDKNRQVIRELEKDDEEDVDENGMDDADVEDDEGERADTEIEEEEYEQEQEASEESNDTVDEVIDPSEWKKAYLDYMGLFSDANMYKFDLIYLDDDELPELYIATGVMATGTWLVTYSDGEIQEVYTGEYDGLAYIPDSGLMHIAAGHGGGYYDQIIQLKNGRFSVLESGSYSQMPDGNGGVDEEYRFDEACLEEYWLAEALTEVTKEEYYTRIAEAFDETKATTTSGQYTYEQLKKRLTDGENIKAGNMSAEEMYRTASDMLGERWAIVEESFIWYFSTYEGDPDGCFWSYGDISIPFTSISDISGDTITAAGARIKVVNPWILEVREDNRTVYVYSGELSAIDEYMRATDTPYIIADSDRAQIDYSMAFDYDVARLARNEIYARHGRKFKDAELQAFFNNREWYNGTIEPEAFSENLLNEVEKYNVQLLLAYSH